MQMKILFVKELTLYKNHTETNKAIFKKNIGIGLTNFVDQPSEHIIVTKL